MANSIKIMIVEDEPIIAEEIAAIVEDLGYEVVCKVLHAKDVMQKFNASEPDMVLMDINLNHEKDGIVLAKEILEHKKLPIIFLTSYADKATISRAAAIAPEGYITKPFDEQDLQIAIELAMHRFEKQEAQKAPAAADNFLVNKQLFVRHKNKLVKLQPEAILYVEAHSNYSIIITPTEKYTLSTTLGIIEEKLKPFGFVRTHRGWLINLHHVDEITEDTVVIAGESLPISKRNRHDFMGMITQL